MVKIKFKYDAETMQIRVENYANEEYNLFKLKAKFPRRFYSE